MSSFCQAVQAPSLMYLFFLPSVVVLQVGSTVQTMIGYHCAHLVKPVSTKHHATKQDVIFLSSGSSVKLDVPFSWPSVVVLQNGSTVQTMIGYQCVHVVKPVSTKHHATKQQIIFLSSGSSVKLDVPCSWPSVVVLQVGSTVQTMIGYHCVHLVKPVSTKHHATKQQIIFLSSGSSVKLDVPCSWLSVVVLQVGSTVQTMIGYHCAHLVKPVSSKHHATKQHVIFLSSVSSIKFDVPYLWPSVVVLQVGSTVQTMIGYHCGTSREASDFETSCNKARCHLFVKRFKRQAWCTFFLTKCGGSSSW